jgi:hypothetical protein
LFERLHHEPLSDRGRDRIARQRVDYRQCCPGHDALSTADWRGNGALSAWQRDHFPEITDGYRRNSALPVEDGRAAFSIAIFNHDGRPANLGMENITAVVNGIPTPVPTYAQLAEAAERKARQAKIGTALFAGVLAGVASTASNQGSYYRHVRGPRGGFTQAIHWQDDTPGVIGATAAVAGGAMVIGGIDRKLDYTLDQLGTEILQTTTIDPGSSFGGMVILPIDRDAGHPADIRVNVAFDGRVYAFGFRLTRSGIGVPAPVPAAARADAPGVQALPVDLAGEGGGE